METQRKISPFVIGFGLIIVIALITFVRPFFNKSSNPSLDQAQTKSIDTSRKISMQDALKNQQSYIFIDVRSAEEFKQEHISNSINIPGSEISEAATKMDKTKSFVILDNGSGQDAINIVNEVFAANGFRNSFFLEGGFMAWKQQVGPTISAGDFSSLTDQSKVTYTTSDKLKELMASENNLFLVDVRNNDQFKEGHLKGAVNIFVDDIEKRKDEIPAGKKIVVYDNDGFQAFQGAVRLYDMGFFNVLSLSDGMITWKQKNFEIVK